MEYLLKYYHLPQSPVCLLLTVYDSWRLSFILAPLNTQLSFSFTSSLGEFKTGWIFLFITFLPGYAVCITQGINFHIPLWWRHNGLKCITVEMTLHTFASERLLKKSGVITFDKKNLPCFGVGYDFYPTCWVFSIPSSRLGDRKHTTRWIKIISNPPI